MSNQILYNRSRWTYDIILLLPVLRTYVVEYIFKQCFKVDSYGILVIPGTVLPVFIECTYVDIGNFKKKCVRYCTVQIFVLTWCHFFHQVFWVVWIFYFVLPKMALFYILAVRYYLNKNCNPFALHIIIFFFFLNRKCTIMHSLKGYVLYALTL